MVLLDEDKVLLSSVESYKGEGKGTHCCNDKVKNLKSLVVNFGLARATALFSNRATPPWTNKPKLRKLREDPPKSLESSFSSTNIS